MCEVKTEYHMGFEHPLNLVPKGTKSPWMLRNDYMIETVTPMADAGCS